MAWEELERAREGVISGAKFVASPAYAGLSWLGNTLGAGFGDVGATAEGLRDVGEFFVSPARYVGGLFDGGSGAEPSSRSRPSWSRGTAAGSSRNQRNVDVSGAGAAYRRQLGNFNQQLRAAQEAAARRAGSGAGAAISNIDKQLGEARADLNWGNEQFDTFMEQITPGYNKAIETAKRMAAAEAAIEAHYAGVQEDVDERYATSEGAVRAIAEKAGNYNASLGEAINSSIYEFKEFIDQGLADDKDGQVKMNNAASALAAAAAESEFAGVEGGTRREQFLRQKQYEDLINRLLEQRAAAVAARSRAIAAARRSAAEQFARGTPRSFQDVRIATLYQYARDNKVPSALQDDFVRFIDFMDTENSRNFSQAARAAGFSRAEINRWAPYAEAIEVGASDKFRFEIQDAYSSSLRTPRSGIEQYWAASDEALQYGYRGEDVHEYANWSLSQLGGG